MSLFINAILAVAFYGILGIAYAAVVVAAALIVLGIAALLTRTRVGFHRHAQPRHPRPGYQVR